MKNIPASDILEQHGVKVAFKGVKAGERAKYKDLAERLYAEVEIQKHRIGAIAGSLNAALSNYQAASQGIKQLQAAQAEIETKVKAFGDKFSPDTNGDLLDDTETSGE
jgi:hypothetical protein